MNDLNAAGAVRAPSKIALHEAAHAVAALHHRIGVARARLTVDGGGDVKFNDCAGDLLDAGRHHWMLALDFAVVALAGCAADGAEPSASDLDLLRMAEWLGIASDLSREVLRTFAKDFVDAHWDEVEAVARALDARLELTGDEIAAVMAGKPIHG